MRDEGERMKKLKVFASNSIRAVMAELVPQFERASGLSVALSYDPAKIVLARIAKGETADLIITGSGAIDALVNQGKVQAASRRTLAR
jgi:molybdate transport system substrate-binding protein